jgi:hypothetical protein
LDNCADENQDVLDFNPRIKAGFEAIDLLKEMLVFIEKTAVHSIAQHGSFHQKIKLLLSKVPVDTEASTND